MDEKNTTPTGNTDSADTNNQATTPASEPVDNTSAESTTPVANPTPAAPAAAPETSSTTSTTKVASADVAPASSGGLKQYGIALAIVVLFGVGLVYALEQQNRIDTNFFGWVQSSEEGAPVATVNGVEITRAEFDQNRNQVIMSAQQQGADVSDPEVLAEIDGQAIEVLVNTQLLRQAATEAGIVVNEEDVDARYQEIVESVGGEETLMTRMTELGITPASLRNDIEGELLVQTLVDSEVDVSSIEITEEEIVSFYEGVDLGGAELPPLEEVRSEIEQQLRATQEQALIAEYIETLRAAADIEILI